MKIRPVSGSGLVSFCEMLKKIQHDWGIAGLCICDYEGLTFFHIKYIFLVYILEVRHEDSTFVPKWPESSGAIAQRV
jgi:hypothetical protein